jgi:hypothetical protein
MKNFSIYIDFRILKKGIFKIEQNINMLLDAYLSKLTEMCSKIKL